MKYFSMFSLLVSVFFAVTLALAETANTLTGTRWQLVSINGQPPVTGTQITLNFGDEGVGGSGGCNTYGGDYQAEGDAIRVRNVFSTMMACMNDGVMEQESAYFAALMSATRFTLTGAQLIMETPEGELVFDRPDSLIGEWRLESIDDAPVLEDYDVTLNFDEEGQASGNASCNQYGAEYTAEGDMLTFGAVIQTEMMCMDDDAMQQENTFLKALNAPLRYLLAEDALTLETSDGQVLVFARVLSLDDTVWELTTFADENVASSLIADTQITLEFDDKGHVYGFSGCNTYRGTVTLNGTNDDALTFSPLVSTRMACLAEGVMEQESAYLNALTQATGYALSSKQLVIFYGDGAQLIFTRG